MMAFYRKYKALISILSRYVVGFLIITWLVKSDLINLKVIDLIDINFALVALVLVFIQVFMAGWRVKILLAEHEIYVRLSRCIFYNSIGVFYSLFLPGGMSGDLARAYSFWRSYPAASKSALFGALFIDRFLGTLAMVVMGLIAGTFLMTALGLEIFLLLSWCVFIAFLIIYFLIVQLHHKGDKTSIRFTSRFLRLIEKIDIKGYKVKIILLSSILSLIGHICAVLIIYLFSTLMHSGLGIIEVITVAPIGLLANALPLTPGGLGIGEKGFDLLYRVVGGVEGGNSFLLSRMFLFAPAVLGALVVLYQFMNSHNVLWSRRKSRK